MSREDLFLILTRGETHRLSEPKLGPVYSHFSLTHRWMRVWMYVFARVRLLVSFFVTVCTCTWFERADVRTSVRFNLVAHLICLLPCFFFYFSAIPHILLYFLFSPIAQVNLLATGRIARFLRLWISCD